MKKKILIALIAMLLFASPIIAKEKIGGSGSGTSGHSVATDVCKNGAGDWRRIGVRISVVNANGQRLDGTRSVDIYQNIGGTGLFAGISGGNMQSVSLNPFNGKEYYSDAYGKLMRGELVGRNAITYVESASTIGGYVWTGLNNVDLSGGSLKRHFINSFYNSNKQDLITMFYMMNYTSFNDLKVVENHYLIIEPLFQFYWDSPDGNCTFIRRYYYGTGTEVLMLLNNPTIDDKAFQIKNSNGTVWNSAIYKNIALGAYIDSDISQNKNYNGVSLAGFRPANSFTSKPANVHNSLNDNYGFATVLIWMGDMITPPSSTECPVEIGLAQDCDNGQYGYVADSENWECVFSNKNASAGTYESEYYSPNGDTTFSGTNPYCTVACIESVSFSFPNTFEVYAGSRFYIATSYNYTDSMTAVQPVKMTGKVTCKTGYVDDEDEAYINIGKFQSDYYNANEEVQNKYDIWQQKEAIYASSGNGVHAVRPYESIELQTSNNGVWAVYNTNKRLRPPQNDERKLTTFDTKEAAEAHCAMLFNTGLLDPNLDTCRVSQESSTVKYKRCYYAFDTFSRNNYNGSLSFESTVGENENCTADGDAYGNTRQSQINAARAAADQAKREYEAAVSYRDNVVLKNIKDCNNFQRTYNEFSPSVSFVYSDKYYKQAHQLTSKSQVSSSSVFYNGSTVTGSKNWSTSDYAGNPTYKLGNTDVYGLNASIKTYRCNGNFARCGYDYVYYPTNTNVEQVTERSYEYELPANLYRYAAKNGVSYNTLAEVYNSGYAFKDLKQSNLPIQYGTKEGTYDYYLDYYYSNGADNLFGRDQKFYKYGIVDPGQSTVYNGLTMSSNLAYHCTYDVRQRFFEEGKKLNDVNVIYRPISLDDPFPGESGYGRVYGSNWQGTTYVNGIAKSYVEAFIENNRGVSKEKVYQLKPMYEFVLSSGNVRAIRKYNREHKNDYNDFTLECVEGYHCSSTFLSEGLDKGYFTFSDKNPDGGTCFGATVNNWESCRY